METLLTVKDSDFERVIKRMRMESEEIAKEKEKVAREQEKNDFNSKTNNNRRGKIAKEIKSVFRFAIVVLGVHPDKHLSLEEFEIIQKELDARAQKETKRIGYFLRRAVGLQTDWGLYKKYGHFHRTRRAFEKRFFKRPLFFSNKDGFLDHHNGDFHVNKDNQRDFYCYPLNYNDLLRQLFQKRYPHVPVPEK